MPYKIYLPLAIKNGSTTDTPAFTIERTLSDGAQRNTIAFDALAFLTGDLGSDSFFPPGKLMTLRTDLLGDLAFPTGA